jgi:hypothetical protein
MGFRGRFAQTSTNQHIYTTMNKHTLIRYYRQLIHPSGTATRPQLITKQFWKMFPDLIEPTIATAGFGGDKSRSISILSAVATFPTVNRTKNRRISKRCAHREHDNKRFIGELPCFSCGGESHHRHHIVPLIMGGTNSNRNQVLLCRSCHIAVHSGADDFLAQLKAEHNYLI